MGFRYRSAMLVLFAIAVAWPAYAMEIVFECPCTAQWTADAADLSVESGELVLSFGVRSYRSVESGELRVAEHIGTYSIAGPALDLDEGAFPSIGTVAAGEVLTGLRATISFDRPTPGEAISVGMWESVAESPVAVAKHGIMSAREFLGLWPVPGGTDPGQVDFVDILADSDGDGIGDVNERIAGTSEQDPASTPGPSTIDVLVLYNTGFRDRFDGYPETRTHHLMVVANAMYVDSGTNVRLRTVGMSEVALTESGYVAIDERDAVRDRHGADLVLVLHQEAGNCGNCASLTGEAERGRWPGPGPAGTAYAYGVAPARAIAHETGHNLGLGHSARQNDSGAFRWSRGHYVDAKFGTIMSYGFSSANGAVFADPDADCRGKPCGVTADETDGADAVRSLDLVRFQVAAFRASKPDSDGDGIVDVADALPDDPAEWMDADGDGIGNIADNDDDNDGVADDQDAFPLDPAEWADVDNDGVGDNADEEVVDPEDFAPFRDPALRTAVERELGKTAGAPISSDDLVDLTTLKVAQEGIRDLTGLDLAVNLEWLDIAYNDVSDLSPLAELHGLRFLSVWDNEVRDISPLRGAIALENVLLGLNPLVDLAPLEHLAELRNLSLRGVEFSDLSVLSNLTKLESFACGDCGITDVAPLAALTGMRRLELAVNRVSDISYLAGMTEMVELNLKWNPVVDLAPVAGMAKLRYLLLDDTLVEDLSPLANLMLENLTVDRTKVSLADVVALPHADGITNLGLSGLDIGDLSPMGDFARVRRLVLADNHVSDLTPLSGLTTLQSLDLSNNQAEDIGPLVDRDMWGGPNSVNGRLQLTGNPLGRESLDEHLGTLESWGIDVEYPDGVVFIPDPALRALVARALRWNWRPWPITKLTYLYGLNAGVTDLAGIEKADRLRVLYLGSNRVSDLRPLQGLVELHRIDLSDNLVSNIGPLVENPGIGERYHDWVSLDGNPLSEESVNVHVPALRARGVLVRMDTIALPASATGGTVDYDVSGFFESELDAGVELTAVSSDPRLLTATVADGVLSVNAGGVGGTATVTVTGTAEDGARRELVFGVTVKGGQSVPLLASATNGGRQGFVRISNRSANGGEVAIEAFDDDGHRHGPVSVAIDAHETIHLNSDDLEAGNAEKGVAAGLGTGSGDWRMAVSTDLDIEVLTYARTADGFVTAMHDVSPTRGQSHWIPTFNPGRNRNQRSLLRLVNHGGAPADVTISGVDDRGRSPDAAVKLSIPAGASRTLTSLELESGRGLGSGLGEGAGKWRLAVESTRPIHAMALLASPTGHLTNLSTVPTARLGSGWLVPWFPGAEAAGGRQGFVRIVNRSDAVASVTVTAYDDEGQARDPMILEVGLRQAVHFNSEHLEEGGGIVSTGTGAGNGDWHLVVASDVDIAVLSYVRHADGFLTSMHDIAPTTDNGHRIAFFNPAANTTQVSRLRIVNLSESYADISITGTDDSGATGGEVMLTIPPRSARSYTPTELEMGTDGLKGMLGDGLGKWRLIVESEQAIAVMSLLESPSGTRTNLSTAPALRL